MNSESVEYYLKFYFRRTLFTLPKALLQVFFMLKNYNTRNIIADKPTGIISDIEWLRRKWSIDIKEIPDKYKMSTFGRKFSSMKSLIKKVSEKGLCILNVEIITVIGEFCDKDSKVDVIAMIDTGASDSFISKRLADFLELKLMQTKGIVWGFNTAYEKEVLLDYSGIYVAFPEVGEAIALNVFTEVDMESKGRDIVLGSDFLKLINFTRIGNEGIFELIF